MSDSIILASSAPNSTKLRGLELLDRAHPENGHIALAWEDLCDLWHCATGTARRHLGGLHEAGLIHYSSNGDGVVYVTFKHLSPAHQRPNGARGRAEMDHPRAETARPRAEMDHPRAVEPAAEPAEQPFDARGRAETARGRAEMDHGRAETVENFDDSSHVCAPAQLVGWLVGSTDQSDPEPTNQPAAAQTTTPATVAPPSVEAAVAMAGLLRVRMKGDQATAIAANVPLPIIREAVGAWWCNRKAAGGQFKDHPGIVVTWLREWYRTQATPWPEPPAAWEREPLFEMMMTPAEKDARAALERELERAYESDPDPEPARPHPLGHAEPEPEPGTPEAFWRQLKADFALHQPVGGVDDTLRTSRVLSYEDGKFVIGVADSFRLDWAEKKMRNQVRRRLAVIMGLPTVDVTFRVID